MCGDTYIARKNDRYVCLRVYDAWVFKRVYDVMFVCVGKHRSLENDRYVCLLLV